MGKQLYSLPQKLMRMSFSSATKSKTLKCCMEVLTPLPFPSLPYLTKILDIPQNQREITFRGFKEGRFHILVATDVASRGLDIPHVDLIIQCEPPKDAETYIHRSGRTARAGKSGIVVTFYTQKQMGLLQKIEMRAGVQFTKIGAPQPEDIMKATSRDVLKSLDKVDEKALPFYQDIADELIQQEGAQKALCLALAYISGNLKGINQRSILTGTDGSVTFQLETAKEFRSLSYVYSILRNLIPQIADEIKGTT